MQQYFCFILLRRRFNIMKILDTLSMALLISTISLPTMALGDSIYHSTEQGLKYKVIKKSTGKRPALGDEVEVRFTSYNSQGELLEGTLNNVPVILPISEMFSGLQQSLLLMPAGSIYEFYIPAHLGYQEEGKKAKQAVKYHIELLRINP
ncbi:peptidylprolyl isomerase [Mannheimia granulomatis]|uniref:Peptidyl-prolyl cis-trans isomerase n=2 Tax=Mannheimia granulomatis TaxID=85402 RepID=A0A6G8JHR5_9PAST|nr:peptidylprolyl isomerase [Mannheimia granulomatis]